MKVSISLSSGILFSVVGILHLLRVIYGLDLTIGTVAIPMRASAVGAVVLALFAVGNFMHSSKCGK